jgi:hypothetical protein
VKEVDTNTFNGEKTCLMGSVRLQREGLNCMKTQRKMEKCSYWKGKDTVRGDQRKMERGVY